MAGSFCKAESSTWRDRCRRVRAARFFVQIAGMTNQLPCSLGNSVQHGNQRGFFQGSRSCHSQATIRSDKLSLADELPETSAKSA